MKYLKIVVVTFLLGALAAWLTSCGQSYHLKKFYKKGGKLETVEKVVTITETIKGKDGKDSIVFRDVLVPCPEPIIETRWRTRLELRFDSKRFRDSLKYHKALAKFEARKTVKINRIGGRVEKNKDKQVTKQVKAKYNLWMILIGLVAGLILHMIISRVNKRS